MMDTQDELDAAAVDAAMAAVDQRYRYGVRTAIRAYLSTLSRRAAPASPVVKGLEWSENGINGLWTGELIFNICYLIYNEGNGFRVFRKQFLSEAGFDEVAFHSDLDTAKAAAQAHFNAAILSALADTASPVGWNEAVEVEYDGFKGDVIGSYVTREGRRGVVVQQHGTKVVHVYGEARIRALAKPQTETGNDANG